MCAPLLLRNIRNDETLLHEHRSCKVLVVGVYFSTCSLSTHFPEALADIFHTSAVLNTFDRPAACLAVLSLHTLRHTIALRVQRRKHCMRILPDMSNTAKYDCSTILRFCTSSVLREFHAPRVRWALCLVIRPDAKLETVAALVRREVDCKAEQAITYVQRRRVTWQCILS